MNDALTKSIQALADPTRRAILQLLNDGDMTAGEIAARFQISAPSISHHLSVLKGASLVVGQRSGQNIIYRLNASVAQEVLQQLIQLFRIGKGVAPAPSQENDHA